MALNGLNEGFHCEMVMDYADYIWQCALYKAATIKTRPCLAVNTECGMIQGELELCE